MSSYLGKRIITLLDEVIEIMESEYDYCPELNKIKEIRDNW